jgi:hypothetical protein
MSRVVSSFGSLEAAPSPSMIESKPESTSSSMESIGAFGPDFGGELARAAWADVGGCTGIAGLT